jgi:hypothetical protein
MGEASEYLGIAVANHDGPEDQAQGKEGERLKAVEIAQGTVSDLRVSMKVTNPSGSSKAGFSKAGSSKSPIFKRKTLSDNLLSARSAA